MFDDKALSDDSSDSCCTSSIDLPPTRRDSPVGLGLILQHQKDSVPVASLLVKDTPSQILDIIFDYAIHKFDDSEDRLRSGRAKFLAVIDKFVQAGQRVETCLPAFPFKSANKVYKVLGPLPDKAEELALERLNTMCSRIMKVYKPGARVTVISDGITYNGKDDMSYALCLNLTDNYFKICYVSRIVRPGHTVRVCDEWLQKRSSLTSPLLASKIFSTLTYLITYAR